ncbi:hypothetical protein PHYSODRAFT_534345 [Phytophthora sojae]|uniref:DNA-directed DNA polymerase n=1 Tax=Phytophthora sojae (strain P6497) TaxID=1094619 RepID=G5AGI7_PHYSP|nr:hypothetical protein PHYSODRAFT_534345 [Phytophthora sojae]EGZ05267.1 hypothetical protein PHYSODRAFT_534345 [Phytophthora sojae]|eukprot:XP_009539188.1 hypothetical protein PHYSODRAFT_534345 [Phytophthora sojae]
MFPTAVDGIVLEKGKFPHNAITHENFDKPIALSEIKASVIEDGYANISEKDRDKFKDEVETKALFQLNQIIDNAKQIDAIQNDQLDNVKYTLHYCMTDVEVMMHCFEAFRKLILDRFKLDVYNFISIPSMSNTILHNEGCFKGCYNLSGPCLMFAREAIVGGRVMTRENKKWHFKSQNEVDIKALNNNSMYPAVQLHFTMQNGVYINALDVISLYPAAQCRIKGLTKGIPKRFTETIPKQATDYIVRVRVIDVKKRFTFPLQSIKNEMGCRIFTNEMIGQTIVLGKVALEDFQKFQHAEVEIIEGMYWDNGFNPQIKKTIHSLFYERNKLKKQKNPLQAVLKLVMNSSYGKLIQKPILKTKRFIRGEEQVRKYVLKNICKLIRRVTITPNISLFEERKSLSSYSSPAHLGVQILECQNES